MSKANDRTDTVPGGCPVSASDRRIPLFFIGRRLFSLSAIPLAAFLFCHLLTNLSVLGPLGSQGYHQALQQSRDIPLRRIVEVLFLWIPTFFHIAYGLTLLARSRLEASLWKKASSIRSFLQALAGVLGLAFVLWHAVEFRLMPASERLTVDYNWIVNALRPPWKLPLYAVGGVSLLFYFSHGLSLFLIRWGITPSPRSQRWALIFCLSVFGLASFLYLVLLAHYRYAFVPAPGIVGWILDNIKFNLY